jgi:hypothetical protein
VCMCEPSLYRGGQLSTDTTMSLADAFAPAEQHYRNQVIAATFGHLAPEPRKAYPGTILFTHSEYGQLVPIRAHFDGLPDSPWFFEHLNDFVADKATVAGGVYRFKGTYMLCKNGNARFVGKVVKLDI